MESWVDNYVKGKRNPSGEITDAFKNATRKDYVVLEAFFCFLETLMNGLANSYNKKSEYRR